jgi:type I restriction enzyme, S subunit
MNTDQLLAHYEQVADAHDAIPRMRRFILDIAVRGKLVEQDPNDGLAVSMMSTIATERKTRIQTREMRKLPTLPAIGQPSFDLPGSWMWLQLGETGNIFNGNSVSATKKGELSKITDGLPFIATKDVGYGWDKLVYDNGLRVPLTDERYKVARTNAIFICAEGGSAGKKIGICDRPICFGNKLFANETWSSINPRYLMFVYLSTFFYEEFSALMTGIIGGISKSKFLGIPVPLPPFAEQNRIVAKVDELMALCDQLEAARAEQEATRDRLAAASLTRLNAPDPDPAAFQNDAAFALDNITPLTARSDQIKSLRQTILNLAVRGKLVEQDPTDEPAAELLERIAAEKARLVEAGKRRKEKSLKPIEPEDELFELPVGWVWARLQDAIDVRDGTHDSPKDCDDADSYPLVTSKDFYNGGIDFDGARRISAADHKAIAKRSLVEVDDILFSMIGGNIGNQVIVRDARPFSIKNVALFKYYDKRLTVPIYIKKYLEDLAYKLQSQASGGAQPFVSLGVLRNLLIALPPTAEQHRIVAKVDELMALCDRLEASLATVETTRQRLLEALLHEALEPASDREAAA